MNDAKHPVLSVYCGILLVASLVFGGGTQQFLWSDHLLQVLLLPAVFLGFRPDTFFAINRGLRWVIFGALVLIAVQFLPFPRDFPAEIDIESGWGLFSPTPGKALDAALFFLSILAFFLVLSLLSLREMIGLLPYIFLGVFANLVIGVVQLSFAGGAAISGLLPYTMRLGLFANVNHFTTMVYMVIPFIAWRFLHNSRLPVAYTGVVLFLIVLQFASGSAAAMGITTLLSAVMFFMFSKKKWKVSLPMIAAGVLAFIGVGLLIINRDAGVLYENERVIMFANTFKGIFDNFVFGSGLSSFLYIYPIYEPIEKIAVEYTYHAHNDYLELWLELGLGFLLLIISYLALIALKWPKEPFKLAAALSLISVLVHSTVDFPLRTMAIAIMFAYANAIYFIRQESIEHPALRVSQT